MGCLGCKCSDSWCWCVFLCVVGYLQVSGVRDNRDTLQAFGVAAARAALHLHTGRP